MMTSPSQLLDLPLEIFHHMISLLPPHKMIPLRMLCSALREVVDYHTKPLLAFRAFYDETLRVRVSDLMRRHSRERINHFTSMEDPLEWKTITFLYICLMRDVPTAISDGIGMILDCGFPPLGYLRARLHLRGKDVRAVNLMMYRNSFIANNLTRCSNHHLYDAFMKRLTGIEFIDSMEGRSCHDKVFLSKRPEGVMEGDHYIVDPFIISREISDIVGIGHLFRKCKASLTLLQNVIKEAVLDVLRGSRIMFPSPLNDKLLTSKKVGEEKHLILSERHNGDYVINLSWGTASPLRYSVDPEEQLGYVTDRLGRRHVVDISLIEGYVGKTIPSEVMLQRRVYLVSG
jgi:hypothetical protein